jgi:hypothetical protein
MKNQLKSTVFPVVLVAIAIFAFGFTQVYAVENGGDDVSITSNSSVSNGGDDSTNSSAQVSNGNDDASNTGTNGSVSNGDDDNQTPGTSNPPGNTPGTDNGSDDDDNDNDGGRRRRGASGSRVTVGTTPEVIVALPNSCPLITSKILRRGANNNAAEVAKLQAFLKNSQGLNVAVTGTFDAQTEAAVHAFQKKYATEVLLPWGGTKSSGIVYITTSKKINQIVCASPLNLTAGELSIINAYRANVTNRPGAVTPGSTNTGTDIFGGTQTGGTVAVGTSTNTSGTSTSENSNVASPARTSLAARFWNFIVGLFR